MSPRVIIHLPGSSLHRLTAEWAGEHPGLDGRIRYVLLEGRQMFAPGHSVWLATSEVRPLPPGTAQGTTTRDVPTTAPPAPHGEDAGGPPRSER